MEQAFGRTEPLHCLSISCLSCKIPLKFIGFIFIDLYMRIWRKHKVTFWEEHSNHRKKHSILNLGLPVPDMPCPSFYLNFWFQLHMWLTCLESAWFPDWKKWEIMISILCFLVEIFFFSELLSICTVAEVIKLRWNMPYATVSIVRPFSSIFV